VSQTTQDDPGIAFLERLLLLSERNPDRTRPASATPNYDELRTASMVNRFQERVQAAERAGAIGIRKGKRERRHLIERVIVQDPMALARHLGRTPAPVVASQIKAALEPVVANAEGWLLEILERMERRWSRGEPAFRIPPDNVDLAREFLTLLAAISADQARGLDVRTFSLRATGNTKAFDRHSSRIAAVLAARFGHLEIRPDLIWGRIGLERFGHPIHLKGCVVVEDELGVLVDGRALPFASLHPEMLPLLRLCGRPSLVITIENYASFNRYVREIDDGALVIYTGGFASVGVVDLLNALLKLLGPAIPFYHWGDIDPGGLRIFRFLEENLPRPPLPHLMDRAIAEAHGKQAVRDATLGTLVGTDSAIAELAEWFSNGPAIKYLEQEALDPVSPLADKSAR
jgi:hypothetical protein